MRKLQNNYAAMISLRTIQALEMEECVEDPEKGDPSNYEWEERVY